MLLEKLAAPFPRESSNEEWWLLPHGEKEDNIEQTFEKMVKIRPTNKKTSQIRPTVIENIARNK